MFGLLEKDLRLLTQRKSTLLMVLFLAIILSFSMSGPFILGYLVCLGIIYASSTISYDEFDNGYPFLMTLPVSPKVYALEKYVFCILSGLFSWIAGVILYCLSMIIKGEEFILKDELTVILGFIPLIIIYVSLMIPFPLKFGAEKTKIVFILISGCILASGVLIQKITSSTKLSFIPTLLEKIGSCPDEILIIALTALLLIFLFVSYLISKHIMEHKEF